MPGTGKNAEPELFQPSDLTLSVDGGNLQCRAAGILIREERLLALWYPPGGFYYLPGGRMRFGETAEQAILRECAEELQEPVTVQRPLWVLQNFFTCESKGIPYQEFGFYFLVECPALPNGPFTRQEENQELIFEWIPLDKLKEIRLVPDYIKHRLMKPLPASLELCSNQEWGELG